MGSIFIRQVDESTHKKLLTMAKKKNMSLSEVINIILERAMMNDEHKSHDQLILDALDRFTTSHNELLLAMEKQSIDLDETLRSIKILIGE